MAGTYRPKPRPKAGVFKLTPEEKAILNKRPTGPKYTPKPRPRTSGTASVPKAAKPKTTSTMATKKSTSKKPSKPLTTKIKRSERPLSYEVGIPFWTKSH